MNDLNEVTLKNVCCTCLSTERRLSKLCRVADGVNNLFFLLSHNSEAYEAIFTTDVTKLYICWECRALMRRLQNFRDQACAAQSKLNDISDGKVTYSKIKCLSKLSHSHQNGYNQEFCIKVETPENFVDCGPIVDVKIENVDMPSMLLTDLKNYTIEKDRLVFNPPDKTNGVNETKDHAINKNKNVKSHEISNNYINKVEINLKKTKTKDIVKSDEVLTVLNESSNESDNNYDECDDYDVRIKTRKFIVKNSTIPETKDNIKDKIKDGCFSTTDTEDSLDCLDSTDEELKDNSVLNKRKRKDSASFVNIPIANGDILDYNIKSNVKNKTIPQTKDKIIDKIKGGSTTDTEDDSLQFVNSTDTKLKDNNLKIRKRNDSASFYVNIPIANANILDYNIKNNTKNEKHINTNVIPIANADILDNNAKNNIKNETKQKQPNTKVVKCYYISEMNETTRLVSINERKFDKVYIDALNKCESCLEVFENSDILEKHISDLHQPKPDHTICKICQTYVRDEVLVNHTTDHYYRFCCIACKKFYYNTNSLEKHWRVQHLMQESFVKEQLTSIHENMSRRRDKLRAPIVEIKQLKILLDDPAGPGYACDYCNKYFKSRNLRQLHVQKQHGEGYQCTACGKRFPYSASLRRHEAVHCNPPPREQCSVCGHMVRADMVKTHARSHAHSDGYQCVACDKKFNSRVGYEAHLKYSRRHADRDPLKHKCATCGKDYRSPGELRDHINYTHKGKTHHKCPICDKALASRRCVTRHVRRQHHGVKEKSKEKICQTCGKGFTYTKSLREHELRHTGERPLSCDICSRTFRQKAALYTHKRRVHKVALKRKQVHHTEEIVELNTELNKKSD